MLLVNQTLELEKRIGIENAVGVLADAGFDALDFTMTAASLAERIMGEDWRGFINVVKRAAAEHNISFVQSHAPFAFPQLQADGAVYDEVYKNIVFPRTLRALEISAELGVKIMVVHPIHYADYHLHAKEMHDKSMAYYRELIPYCREFGVKVALENMWQCNRFSKAIEADTCSCAYEFAAWVDELDSEYITGCLDIGHCGLTGEDAAQSIRIIGADRIGCLHVHDNDNVHDSHTLPGVGKINWKSVTKALHDTGYQGNFTFEADEFYNGFEDEFLPEAAKFMCRRGRQLIKMVEE